jgi:hypothetical protein
LWSRHRDERATITRRDTEPGDHVDLLALVDVLAVPNVCGADVMRTSNFALKPIRVTLFEATDEDMAATPKTPILKSQRTPKDFRNPTIKTDRRLTRDSSYVAEFVNTPIRLEDVAVELSDEEATMLDGLRLPVYGADDGSALRDILFIPRNPLIRLVSDERIQGNPRKSNPPLSRTAPKARAFSTTLFTASKNSTVHNKSYTATHTHKLHTI